MDIYKKKYIIFIFSIILGLIILPLHIIINPIQLFYAIEKYKNDENKNDENKLYIDYVINL